jgi:hypothetical protein
VSAARYVFGDTQAAVATLLRDVLADATQPYALGATVGTRVPRGATPPPLPYVLVAVDGSEVVWPVVQRNATRVTVWHRDADSAYDLAQLAHGVLLSEAGPLACHARLGPLRSFDVDTETDLAWFAVRVSSGAVGLVP